MSDLIKIFIFHSKHFYLSGWFIYSENEQSGEIRIFTESSLKGCSRLQVVLSIRNESGL